MHNIDPTLVLPSPSEILFLKLNLYSVLHDPKSQPVFLSWNHRVFLLHCTMFTLRTFPIPSNLLTFRHSKWAPAISYSMPFSCKDLFPRVICLVYQVLVLEEWGHGQHSSDWVKALRHSLLICPYTGHTSDPFS